MSGRRLTSLRAAGVLAGTLVLLVTNLWLESRLSGSDDSSLAEQLSTALGFLAFGGVGALILWKRPGHGVGRVLSATALVAMGGAVGDTYAAVQVQRGGQPDALAVFGAWFSGQWLVALSLAFIYLPLLFPDGRLPSRRWRWVAALPAIGLGALTAVSLVSAEFHGTVRDYVIDNPIGIAGVPPAEESAAAAVALPGLVIGILAAAASLIVRFRRSRGDERRQIKWVAYVVMLLPLQMIEALNELSGDIVFALTIVGLPAAIGVAVLRYRLYEIDRIVSRTVSYAIITVLLLGLYAGTAVAISLVVPSESSIGVAVATLGVAAAFRPVRRRVQHAVDRRFNRARFDADRTVAEFQQRARDAVDLDELAQDLLRVVGRTLEPQRAGMWLRHG